MYKSNIAYNKTRKYTIIILLLFIILVSSDTLIFGTSNNEVIKTCAECASLGLGLALFFYSIAMKKNKYIVTRPQVSLFVVCTFILFDALIHQEFSGGYLLKITYFVLGFSLISIYGKDEFIDNYINIISIVAVVSLIGFVFSDLLTRIPLPTVTNTSGGVFKTLILTNIPLFNIHRNFGPFSEPSRYQLFLNIALFFLLFVKQHVDVKKVILIITTVITTLSTTGLITLILLFIGYLFKKNIKNTHKILLVLICVMLLGSSIVLSQDVVNAFLKIERGEASSSFASRYNSIIAGLILVKDNFFFGTGIEKASSSYINAVAMFSDSTELSNANTILIHFSKFGFIVGFYFLINFIRNIKYLCGNKNWLIPLIALIVSISGISFLDSMFVNTFVFIYLSKRMLNEQNRIKHNKLT